MTELSLPQGITAVTENGLPAYRVETESCTGLVYQHGAHVAAWAPAGAEPVLWMSGSSMFDTEQPIRGGVPLCFPWFGPGRDGAHKPAHGPARVAEWNLVAAEMSGQDAVLTFELPTDGRPDELPADAQVRYMVTMGEKLTMALQVAAGESAVDYEAAMHSYLTVGDARTVRLEGLDGASYLDKLDGEQKTQSGDVTFTGETDRVYSSTGTVTVVDDVLNRRIQVAKSNSANTVVWNPWTAKAAAMADFGNDEWTGMCCVETANVLADAITLQPGEGHEVETTISLA